MMCLGWKAQTACVELTAPGKCPDITWFWLGLAVVGIGAVMGGGKKKESGSGPVAG